MRDEMISGEDAIHLTKPYRLYKDKKYVAHESVNPHQVGNIGRSIGGRGQFRRNYVRLPEENPPTN